MDAFRGAKGVTSQVASKIRVAGPNTESHVPKTRRSRHRRGGSGRRLLLLTVWLIQLLAYVMSGHKSPEVGALLRTIGGATNKCIRKMTAFLCLALSIVILMILLAWGGDKGKDEETLQNAGKVLQEMLKSDSVPSGVLAKADCVIVLPDVKKVGFGIGGSGGRAGARFNLRLEARPC